MSVKGTKTEKNLLNAMKGEAFARSKYTFFANIARAEGYDIAARMFDSASNNEKEHAKLWFKLLNDGELPSTESNLKNAIKGENFEWSNMYVQFALEAKEEGFDYVSELFQKVANIEKEHENNFKKLLDVLDETAITPDIHGKFIYECSACGCVIEQNERPDYCPLCEGEDIFFFKK